MSTSTHLQLVPELAERIASGDDAAVRMAALRRYESLGLPSQRDEDWRHTPLRVLREKQWTLADDRWPEFDLDRWSIEGVRIPRIVFVGDRFDPGASELDAVEGVVVIEPTFLEPTGDGLDALGAAATSSPWSITVAKGRSSRLHLLFISDGTASFPRLRLHIEEGAECEIIEDHVSAQPGDALCVMRVDVELGKSASLTHERLVRNDSGQVHLANMSVRQARDSRLKSVSVGLGGTLVRHAVDVELAGENAECELTGLVVAEDEQIFDNHSRIEHAAPHTRSKEHFRNVLDGRSRGVFAGRVIVADGVAKTESEQSNANLLLSDSATINALPQLEIYNDDVKASHGSTIGQLDPDALFYLRSRGIDQATARAMLTFGFANSVVETIPSEGLRELVRARVHAVLEGEGGA